MSQIRSGWGSVTEHRLIFRVLEGLSRLTGRLVTAIPPAGTFLLGLLVNEVSHPDSRAGWAFLRWSQLSAELVEPSRNYHPTAGLRMLFAGIAKYGVFGFNDRIGRALR